MSDPNTASRLTNRYRLADAYLNGSSADRLQRERAALLQDENAYKRKLEGVADFRKTEIIPVGKLQRAVDETDSESEGMSTSEEGTVGVVEIGGTEAQQTMGPDGGVMESSSSWDPRNSYLNASQMSGGDLDADVEDLDDVEDGYIEAGNGEETSGERSGLEEVVTAEEDSLNGHS